MRTLLSALLGRLGQWANRLDPIRMVVFGYLSYVLLGWFLLSLPPSQSVRGAPFLDHLFMAVSAMSTTGLTTFSTADTYSFFGELVILVLIQVGGLGYMTLGSFVVLAWSGRLSDFRERVGGAVFPLPAGLPLRSFLRVMIFYALAIEAAGAAALYFAVFLPHGLPQPAWQAVFHSVSAFCTAGFGLFNDSLESLRGDRWLNLIVIALSYLGAIGFIVVSDAWHAFTRKEFRMTLTSKIILLATALISMAGTLLLCVGEKSLAGLPLGERWLAAWFQTMTASTTVGFNTVPLNRLSETSVFLLMLLMLIGASPAGTGGGIKTTTLTALWAVMIAVLARRRVPTFLGREIPKARIRAAVAGFLFYGITLAVGTYALAATEAAGLIAVGFEAVSALGTVGLSLGVTGELSPAGKVIVILLMFMGRVGPLAFGMAFFLPAASRAPEPATEDVAL